MKHATLAVFLAAALSSSISAAAPTGTVSRIVTGSERGTYIQIGRDLSRWVAKPAGIDLKVLPSLGSTDNVRRLRSEVGVQLALVQSDVYQAFLDEAMAGNEDALSLVRPLKVVMPLYDEEIYFVVRADSPLTYIHEVKDKRINIGPLGSGTALSATTIYRAMFGTSMPEKNTTLLGNEDALLKLVTDRSIDVVVVVAGQPAKLFAEMKPEARQYIKLLRLDVAAVPSQSAMQTYFASDIKSASYPNWLAEDVPTLTTKALLVTYGYKAGGAQKVLTTFAHSLCRRFKTLRAEGHPKWQEVTFDMPRLGSVWSYYSATEKVLSRCAAAVTPSPARDVARAAEATTACPQDKQVLGICQR